MQRVWPNVVVTEDSLVQAVGDIRRVLGDNAHQLLRTVPRHGYMLVATRADSTPQPASHSAALVPPRPRAVLLVAALSAVLLVALAWWRGPPVWSHEPPQIAVLAFRDRAGTPEGAMLARGLAEDVLLQLGRNQGLRVVAQHSSFSLYGKDLAVTELGRQLRAQYLVDGVIQRDGDRLRIEIELIDAQAGRVLWVSRHETDGGDVVRARDAVVQRVAGTLFSKVRETERQLATAAPPESLDVYALTQKGLALKHRFNAEATREARAGLEWALQIDPRYAPAWAVLGWLNSIDGQMRLTGEWSPARAEEALAQTRRAVELDPSYPLAYSALASTYTLAGRVEEAAAAAARAVELAPGDAEAKLTYAYRLLPARPPEEALQAMQQAVELYPIAPPYFDAMRSMVLWANSRNDAALSAAQACTQRAPGFRDCRVVQALVLVETGRLARAREQIAALGPQAQGYSATKACVQYGGSAANVLRCRSAAQAAGLPLGDTNR
jgi:TolB-like protein